MNQDKVENQVIVEEKITKVTGEEQIRKYSKGRLLGKGGFAKCYEFRNIETNQITAAKVIAKSSLVKSRAKQKLISEIKNNKDYFDQSIDEIKLLRYINANGDPDDMNFLRIYDYFYYKKLSHRWSPSLPS